MRTRNVERREESYPMPFRIHFLVILMIVIVVRV